MNEVKSRLSISILDFVSFDKSFYISKLSGECYKETAIELGTYSRGLFNLACTNKEHEE